MANKHSNNVTFIQASTILKSKNANESVQLIYFKTQAGELSHIGKATILEPGDKEAEFKNMFSFLSEVPRPEEKTLTDIGREQLIMDTMKEIFVSYENNGKPIENDMDYQIAHRYINDHTPK